MSRKATIWLCTLKLCALAMLLAFPLLTSKLWAAPPKAPENVRQLMQDRNYPEALKALDAAAKEKDAPADYLTYLQGRVLYLQAKYDESAAMYGNVEKKFPDSSWARRARFGAAVALARKGDFKAAELIYQNEAEALLSVDRKHELADIYLEFADRFFKPAENDQKPDFQKALDFYTKALEVGPKNEKRIEVELLIAECQQNLGKPAEAAGLYAKFSKEHPDSPLDIEARYRLGECQLAQNQLAEARRTWQDLLAKYVDNPSERIAEAAYAIARTYQMPQPASDEDLTLGVAALESFIERFPEHKLASHAHLVIAQAYIHRGRFEDAVTSLTRFLKDDRYAKRDEIPEARNLLGRSYQLQKKFAEALATWQEYLTMHPAHEGWSAVQRAIIDTEYLMAQEMRDEKKYDEARKLWTDFLAKYPLEARAATILFEFGQMQYDQEKYDEAMADWKNLVSKYPNTNESSKGQYLIAATLEEKQGKLKEALKEYRKVTWGDHAPLAQQRAAALTVDSLTLVTERVFRTDETPKLKLTTRNIESVTVRAYTVDLETYFRKMHLGRGVEGLDIALIDPDKSFEFKIPDYAKYQQIESQIEVPLPGEAKAGVLAVTVSSKLQEATTLVVQSDLDIVVKSSRDEVFVFAENLRTGKAWPKARLLVSNGKQVFAEATTGDDGVFQKSFKDLKTAADVRVFAVADDNVASNVVGLQGVGVSKGVTDKGYIYTERAAYRAGQMVHVRGIIRKVSGDTYTVEKDKKFTVQVLDPRSRMVWEQEIALSEFGSFGSHFALPSTSPVGEYRITVHSDDGQNYQGAFLVHEYQLEPVRMAVDTPRKVYYRGEEIVGKITASFYYGAPLAGREITYQLGGDRVYTATTNEKGEIEFKLPTREFRETQVLPLTVTLAERNLRIVNNFFLATQGFTIEAAVVRPVYLAGESFEASFTVKDAEGKPRAEKLVLSVMEQTTVDGKVGERLVEKHDLATDAKTGIARQTLTLKEGGKYILRASGTDRFHNTVTGQQDLQISDDKDTVRLRILADKHTFKVGDKADVILHWREAPTLALVTFQGARVLDYKIVTLKQGENKLPIPMKAKLAPNFELSVAVMTDAKAAKEADKPKDGEKPKEGDKKDAEKSKAADKSKQIVRFHEASSPFTVERDLQVKIEVKRQGDAKQQLRPGDPLEVKVTTTDPQGKPVAAEISLAMIEQALVERFGSNVPAVQDFFRGAARVAAVRTTASITFEYRPATQAINVRLLAEKDRALVATEEAESLKESGIEASVAAVEAMPVEMPATEESYDASDMDEKLFQFNRIAGTDSEVADVQAGGAASFGITNGSGSGGAMTGRYVGNRSLVINDQMKQQLEVQSARTKLGAIMQKNRSGSRGGEVATEAAAREAFIVAGKRQGGANADGVYPVADLVLPLGDTWGAEAAGLGFANFSGQAQPQNPSRADDFGTNFYRPPSSGEFQQLREQNRGEVWYLAANGAQVNLNFDRLSGKESKEVAEKLSKAGALLIPQLGAQEIGYWNPSIITDADGTATVTFDLPERSTAWKIFVKGVTTETLAGEAETELAVKKELFGELKLPLAFTDGDKADILVSVHNDAVEKGAVEVTLKTTVGDKTTEEKKTIDFKAKGIEELSFKAAFARPEAKKNAKADEKGEKDTPAAEPTVAFELTIAAGERKDVLRRSLPLLPYGMPVYATTSGSASSDITDWVEPPAKMPLEAAALQIIVGPRVERSLLDVVLAPAPMCQLDMQRIASGLDVASSDLMASIALQKLLGVSRDASTPEAQSLDARIRSALGILISAQNEDGGWCWTERGPASNRYSSARVVWALSLAKAAGYAVAGDAYEKSLAYLRGQIAATSDTDYESKAILLQALTAAGQGDFALANRLHRERPSLSTSALVHVAIALADMDRKSLAQELLALIEKRDLDDVVTRRTAALGALPWSNSAAELRALYALALQKTDPESAKSKELVDWLLKNRVGHRWSPEKATGPATIALCDWFAKNRFKDEHYELTIFVNDLRVKVLDIGDAVGTQVIDVPARMLKGGKERINFQIAGRGRFTYQCILSGFVPADKLESTTQDWHVERHYEPAPLELDGREIPRGFDVLQGSYQTFRNPLTQLPVGRRGQVELVIWRTNVPANTPEEHLEYLVVTEPIPSGATVIEQSIGGGFERYEISPGQITFYIGSRQYVEAIHYSLHGYLPGEYRAAPTLIRNAYRPEQVAVSKPKTLAVLPLGGKSEDPYQLTPRELFELGKRQFEKGEFKLAAGHLAELMTKWNLAAEPYKESARMLLDVYLETNEPKQIVHYFEIIKEKWPDLEIPFAKILKVGAAYHEMAEYERSYLIFRATVESSFLRESGVAGFLETQGEFARSVEVMERLLREYPPEPYIAAATYALAQRVYAKAPEAAADPKLREKKINRVVLVRQALSGLEDFLTAYPEDPAADQGGFSVANALLELKSYQKAIEACNRFAERYPKSDYLDSYWYVIGYSHFALGEHKDALEMCRKVAEAKRIDKATGRETASPNKWRAIYILGQVYHSLGEAADAIREYGRVKNRFSDAKQAIEYFTRKQISLPEVTTVEPGKASEVELSFRNVPSCDTKVYRIDLMKFSLLQRNLGNITKINLAGIRPLHEATIELGDGKDYKDRKHKIELPLKEEGAYLVVCRGEDLHASGLVLVTPLAVEVQEEAPSGRVRTTVKDVTKDRYLPEVQIKVIGTRNPDFMSGQTDLRGVFVADGIQGTSTVIAQAEGGRYAFFRGQLELGPPPAPAQQPAAGQPANDAKSPQKGKGDDLLEELRAGNSMIQQQQQDNLKRMYNENNKGVKAKAAY